MKFIIAVCLFSSSFAAPQYYGRAGGAGVPPVGVGRGRAGAVIAPGLGGVGAVGTGEFVGFGAAGGGPCPLGQKRNIYGICVEAIFTQSSYVFQGPPTIPVVGPPPEIPAPRVDYDVIFVRTPEQQEGGEPIVIPPPEKRTIVYVLTKNGSGQQQVIEVPALPGQAPEVFYVNYNDGDNPKLAGGLTLQEVLESGSEQGQALDVDAQVSGQVEAGGLGAVVGSAGVGGIPYNH